MDNNMVDIVRKIYYLDDKNNIVDENEATHAIIKEFDKDGTMISERFVVMKTENPQTEQLKDLKNYK